MSFRIKGLDPTPFLSLFGLSDEALAAQCIVPSIADEAAGFPDRVELRDAAPGERVLLLNFTHQPANTPYRASHAIFVREGAMEAYDRVDEVPGSLSRRLLSVRAFGEDHRMVDADVIEGGALEALIERFLARPDVAYLHAHFAKRGCYAARIERA
jgi:hypothetical protein